MRYLILLLLAGCSVVPPAPEHREVRIVWHKTPGTHIFTKDGVKPVKGRYKIINGVCHVFAPDPPMEEGKYVFGQWGTLGHEIKHCFDGNFHK